MSNNQPEQPQAEDDISLSSQEDPTLMWSHMSSLDRLPKGESTTTVAKDDQQHSPSTTVILNEDSLLSDHENVGTAMLSYSRTNKLDKLQALLDAKARGEIELDLNFKGQHKQNFSWTALHLACYFGHEQVVQLLLSRERFGHEVNINIQNNSGDTPLHKAALTDRVSIVQLLLSYEANVFINNCDGLLAKQLANNSHVLNMIEAAEQFDRNKTIQAMFKAVDNGDLEKLKEYFANYDMSYGVTDERGSEQYDSATPHNNQLIQKGDERGNTLLHIATMRDFQAICIHLLELGFDPYVKNNLGQSSIDLASPQLRQLFISVKPANAQLKRLSSQRVARFEGPLLRKVRILGWRQIYVVLENGVLLFFNNRRNSMNKSRRGYKYLESATCSPETSDSGTFSVCFSDKSKATFLVSTEHLNNYISFLKPASESERPANSEHQIELIRQMWIDSIMDHIRYSTEFIRNGLRIDDDTEAPDSTNNQDLASINHLLPVDTIRSIIQEARAHYSILERHAESLCNVVQSIGDDYNQQTNIIGPGDAGIDSRVQSAPASGSRLLGFIKPYRTKGSIANGEDTTTYADPPQSSRMRHNSLTNQFLQDNWHCILFHLRLLVESTENTKETMGQALALMEHQEQIRQNHLQDQRERCRVLEDSLHALARDHHQLEKSISMSQIYHTATNRSMSVSTDLNEYYDAFEDFDEDNTSRTLTPTSLTSEDDLHKRLQEVLNEHEASLRSDLDAIADNKPFRPGVSFARVDETNDEEADDDDIQSNCSALTVATLEDPYSELRSFAGNVKDINHQPLGSVDYYKSRTKLPSPMVPRDQVSIWSILKNCIGKELSKITMPVVFNEPLTMLQRACEVVQFSQLLKEADESEDPVERMQLITAFIVASLSENCHRFAKPFNPLLYETYEYTHELQDGSKVTALGQQVSHHPPITVVICESDHFINHGSINPKIKFWGRSVEIDPNGICRIYLKNRNENYIFKPVACSLHNIIVGKLWFEHQGPLDIRCLESNYQCNLTFKQAGWFSNDLHRFEGFIVGPDGRKHKYVYGKWDIYVKSADYLTYETYMRDTQQKSFKIPDNPSTYRIFNAAPKNTNQSNPDGSPRLNNHNNNNVLINAQGEHGETSQSNIKSCNTDKRMTSLKANESLPSADIPGSKTLWQLQDHYLAEYYNFTHFTLKLNEMNPRLEKEIAPTDSRFRLDVRKLEDGDLDGAAAEKQRLEDKQRANRAKDKRFREPSSDLLWFDLKNIPGVEEKLWIYKGGYWENKCNPSKFPHLF